MCTTRSPSFDPAHSEPQHFAIRLSLSCSDHTFSTSSRTLLHHYVYPGCHIYSPTSPLFARTSRRGICFTQPIRSSDRHHSSNLVDCTILPWLFRCGDPTIGDLEVSATGAGCRKTWDGHATYLGSQMAWSYRCCERYCEKFRGEILRYALE